MDTRVTVKLASSYQDASDYSLQLNRWFLKPVGIWLSSSTSIRERMLSLVLIVICYSLIAYSVIPCILNLLFEETDLQTKLTAVGPLSHWCMGGMNYFSLLFRTDDIRHCVQHVKNDWKTTKNIEDRQVMMKYARFGRHVAGLCAIFMHGGVLSYSVVKGTSPKIIYIGNESLKIHVLPLPSYTKFVDARQSPAGEIVLTLQFISGIIVNSVTVGACSLAAVFAMHACGQLNVLMKQLNNLVDDQEQSDKVQRRLANIVDHHLSVLSFVARMESLLNQICFVELLGCTFNLCMIGYYAITGWNTVERKVLYADMIVYVSMTFNIFIFCYIGEVLTEQCKQVGEITYMINWYRLPHKTALCLILIISRSSIVTKLTAGKLVHLSIGTFGDVMRTSVMYLNMLRTMTT